MDTKQNFGSSFNRRSFLQRSTALGVGALGLESFLAACGSATTTTSGVVTATVNAMPPSSNTRALYVFNQLVKQFFQAYPHPKILGKKTPSIPTTYFSMLAAA